jgi:S-formylglutathione hydrolase
MEEYVLSELPTLLRTLGGLDVDCASIMGHSMGGHGALTLALKNPSKFHSVSAFAPICNPINAPWGQKAFSGYLGEEDKESWKRYDATELLKDYVGPKLPVLMDTGTADDFLESQLQPWAFEKAAAGKLELVSNMREGYDHSYYFIATFMEDHVAFHAKALKGA